MIGRVVRQDDHGRGLDECSQRRNVVVTRIEAHRIRDPATPRLFYQGIAVSLAVGGNDLRVRRARDQISGPAGHIAKRPHRLDHPLDALTRAQQAPSQQGRSTTPQQDAVGTIAPWGMVETLRRSMSKPDKPFAGRIGHHDHLVCPRRKRLENGMLLSRRAFGNGVGDHDRWNAQPLDNAHYFVSVDAAVDAVLMLDDRNVALVQQFSACCNGCR